MQVKEGKNFLTRLCSKKIVKFLVYMGSFVIWGYTQKFGAWGGGGGVSGYTLMVEPQF